MWPKNDSILSVLQQTGDKTNCCANNGRMQNLSGQCGQERFLTNTNMELRWECGFVL